MGNNGERLETKRTIYPSYYLIFNLTNLPLELKEKKEREKLDSTHKINSNFGWNPSKRTFCAKMQRFGTNYATF